MSMDLAGFEPAAFTFRTEGSAFASGATSGHLFFTGFDSTIYKLKIAWTWRDSNPRPLRCERNDLPLIYKPGMRYLILQPFG